VVYAVYKGFITEVIKVGPQQRANFAKQYQRISLPTAEGVQQVRENFRRLVRDSSITATKRQMNIVADQYLEDEWEAKEDHLSEQESSLGSATESLKHKLGLLGILKPKEETPARVLMKDLFDMDLDEADNNSVMELLKTEGYQKKAFLALMAVKGDCLLKLIAAEMCLHRRLEMSSYNSIISTYQRMIISSSIRVYGNCILL